MTTTTQTPQPVLMPGLKTSILIWSCVTLFITLMTVVLVPPVMDAAAKMVQCADAPSIYTETEGGGITRTNTTVTRQTATTITTLFCEYPDGTMREISNDTRFLSGIAVAGGFGLLLGVLIPVLLRIRYRLTRR